MGHENENLLEESKVKATRKDFQLGRRVFHMSMGIATATAYNLLVTHERAIYILGTTACLIYLVEQIRINYPEFADRLSIVSKYFLRAEEQLHESAAIPYIMAILLTILSFPKIIALVAIYTLAISDPLSAIIGIKFGKHKIRPNKSVEGSLAFFLTSFLCCLLILLSYVDGLTGRVVIVSLILSLSSTCFELLPIKIDDNLTIPLFTAFTLWILCAIFAIPLA